MAIYSLRPLTGQQIHRRRRDFLLGLAVSLIVLAGSAAAWMNLRQSETRDILFYLSCAAAIMAIACWFALWSYPDSLAGRTRSAYEITPQGVRFSTGLDKVLGKGSSGEGLDTRYLNRPDIRYFEVAPNGGIAIRGRLGCGTIAVPRSLEGIEGFRQELLALGIREVHRSRSGWLAFRAAAWSAFGLVGLLAGYMLWGSIPWLVVASTVAVAAVLAWNWWIVVRLHKHQSRSLKLLLLAVWVFFLFQDASRAWHLQRSRPAGQTDTTSSSQR